jgi:hypothetical protein
VTPLPAARFIAVADMIWQNARGVKPSALPKHRYERLRKKAYINVPLSPGDRPERLRVVYGPFEASLANSEVPI